MYFFRNMNQITQYALSNDVKKRSTSNQLVHIQTRHLEEYHQILQNSTEQKMTSIKSFLSTQPEIGLKLLFNIKLILTYLQFEFDEKKFRNSVLKKIVCENLPFSTVESKYFSKVVENLHPNTALPTRKRIRLNLVETFNNYFK